MKTEGKERVIEREDEVEGLDAENCGGEKTVER